MREVTVPPTAGLPLQLTDLLPWPAAHFAQQLAQWLRVDEVQL